MAAEAQAPPGNQNARNHGLYAAEPAAVTIHSAAPHCRPGRHDGRLDKIFATNLENDGDAANGIIVAVVPGWSICCAPRCGATGRGCMCGWRSGRGWA
jgi:hypothetical protein